MKFAIGVIVLGGVLLWLACLGCDHDKGGYDRIHPQPSEDTDTKKDSEKPHQEARLKHLKPTPDYPER